MDGSWDYIVVGAGSAGCVVARRLSDRRDLRILVLEAGDRDWSPYLQVPAGRIRMNVKYDWNYPAEPDPTRGGKVENWESGKVLGGTSSINGMNWSRGDRVHVARCRREVIVSAGAIGSPKLLLLSGIGPADDLGGLGLEVVADRPGVGRHMRSHMGTIMLFEVDMPTLNRSFTPWSVVKHGLNLLVFGRGPATASLSHAQVYGSIRGGRVDHKFGFGPYGRFKAKETGRYRDTHKLQMTSMNAVTVRPALLHPKAIGSITLRSADPMDPPLISYPLLSDADDVELCVEVCRRVREVMATEPMSGHILREPAPGPEVQSDDEWRESIRQTANVGKHTCGTCKMGTDEMAVVDPELRVHGIAGLRVIDASVMPSITSGGTNAPTIMIGERGADFVMASAQ